MTETLALRLGEALIDQIIRMIHQFANQRGGNTTVKHDGIPVLLVHVISRGDAIVLIAQSEGSFGIAFEIGECRKCIDPGNGENPAAHLIHQYFRAERGAFLTMRKMKTVINEIGQVHEDPTVCGGLDAVRHILKEMVLR